jgi:hypothetical protein
VTGGWAELYNKEVHNLPSIIRMMMSKRMRWAGHVAQGEEKRSVYGLFVGKPDCKPKCRWVVNIEMDLGGME